MVSLELDTRTGIGLMVLTVCFFHLLNRLCEFLPLPTSVTKRNDTFRIFRWRNLIISWFHACIVGSWSFMCVLLYYKEMWADMFLFINGPTFGLCCFTTGYFIYDTLDIVVARRIVEKWEILAHHSAIMFSAGYIIVSTHCVGYQVFAMLIELNTSFLHTRKLLQMAAVPRVHPLVQLNIYVNLVTFIIFRFGPLGVLFYGIFKDGHRVPPWYLVQYTACVAVLIVINVILLYRLLRADVMISLIGLVDLMKSSQSATKNHFRKIAAHRKTDSTGGFCASLNIVEDEFPPNSHSRNASVAERFDENAKKIN